MRSILLDSAVYGHIPQNSGLTRPIRIVAPRGSLANPIFPAPVIARFCPGNQLADTVMKALAGRNDHSKVAYGTEAGLFQTLAGIPTVVIGPGHIEQAHKADEWVAEEQLAACSAFVEWLIEHCRA